MKRFTVEVTTYSNEILTEEVEAASFTAAERVAKDQVMSTGKCVLSVQSVGEVGSN